MECWKRLAEMPLHLFIECVNDVTSDVVAADENAVNEIHISFAKKFQPIEQYFIVRRSHVVGVQEAGQQASNFLPWH